MSVVVAGENDETLDAYSPIAINQRPDWDRTQTPFEMELLEGDSGSVPIFNQLLQTRLRFAAFALGIGFAIFCAWSWIHKFGPPTIADAVRDLSMFELGFQTSVTAILLGIGFWLRRIKRPSESTLNWCELAIFGLPSMYLAVVQTSETVFLSQNYDLIPHLPIWSWVTLIFAYTVFVPHGWRRVLVGVIGISLLPIVATIVACVQHPDVRSKLWVDVSCVVEMVLALIASALTSVSSVKMISQLRSKADEAKELGRYRLKEKIGSGGMGDVYLAEHRLMKRPCAIKVIRPDKAGDPRAIARFEREVRATAKLNHWNNISIYDYGRTRDGKFYYVMEYLPGLTLQELVKLRGPMAPARCVYILKQVCNALMEAHHIQLVHRDIKPANVIVTELGGAYDVAKLVDFGLAKPIVDEFQGDDDGSLTIAGTLTGSPLYISPEQAMGEGEADHRSDIYGIGGLAFYMLTGQPPFQAGPTLKILLAHLHEAPIAPSTARAKAIRQRDHLEPNHTLCSISKGLDEIVLKCLAKTPDDRFQTVADLRTAFEELPENRFWSERRAEEWWSSNCKHYQSEFG